MAAQAGLARQSSDLLDELLARLVARMRLAGEDHLYGPLAVGKNALKARQIAQNERCAFVRGKTPAKADGESVGIEHFFGGFNFRLRGAAAQALLAHPVPSPGNQALAPAFVGTPQLFGGNR
jgi:hypothetical protein